MTKGASGRRDMKKEKQTSPVRKAGTPARKAAVAGPAVKKTAGGAMPAAAAAKPAGAGAAAAEKPSARTAPAKQETTADKFEPRIIAFVCRWCSDAVETHASKRPAAGSPAVRFVSVMCSGRVQPSLVLKAFELGADGVIVCGCGAGKCHYYFGNERQAEMFETSKKLVSLLGLGPERLRLEWIPGADADALGAVLDEFTQQVRRTGPSPLRK